MSLRMPATVDAKPGANGAERSRAPIRNTVAPASIPPDSDELTPCATEYSSGPGTTNATNAFIVSTRRFPSAIDGTIADVRVNDALNGPRIAAAPARCPACVRNVRRATLMQARLQHFGSKFVFAPLPATIGVLG